MTLILFKEINRILKQMNLEINLNIFLAFLLKIDNI